MVSFLDDDGNKPAVALRRVHGVRKRTVVIDAVALAQEEFLSPEHDFQRSVQDIIKFLPGVAVRLLFPVVFANRYDEGFGELILEIVGKVMVQVLVPTVELQPFARAREHINRAVWGFRPSEGR